MRVGGGLATQPMSRYVSTVNILPVVVDVTEQKITFVVHDVSK